MKTPQQFIYDWALVNDHKIFVNLDKERYWLEWTDVDNVPNGSTTWHFEYNSTSDVPNRDYEKIKKVMRQNGYQYCFDLIPL